MAPLVEALAKNPELAIYVKPLHDVILTRLLQQLSKVYTSVNLDFVVQLASFPKPYDYDTFRIEKFILKGCRKQDFNIRIDHVKKQITFDDQPLVLKSKHSTAKIAAKKA